jgi:hypothetical protein
MNPPLRSLTYILPLFLFLNSCSTRHQANQPNPITAHWDTKNFSVHFQAGPRDIEGRSYSFYQIIRKSPNHSGDRLVMESAHSTRGFESNDLNHPEDWARVIADPNGEALIIEEDIPNDCAPCKNYLWVNSDSNGNLEGTYFSLPSKSTGNGGIDYHYPKVISLNGDLLKYQYKTGQPITKNVQSIEKADRPTPPG